MVVIPMGENGVRIMAIALHARVILLRLNDWLKSAQRKTKDASRASSRRVYIDQATRAVANRKSEIFRYILTD
jgi:hypothetical protein